VELGSAQGAQGEAQGADILAYILSFPRFPNGKAELLQHPELLQKFRIEASQADVKQGGSPRHQDIMGREPVKCKLRLREGDPLLRARSYRALLLPAVALTLCLRVNGQANAPRSTITIHVHKSGLFSAFAHDHVITAPIARGALDPKAMTVQITVATKQMKVADPDVSEKDRAEIQSTMLGPKVLDPEKYPEIRFTSSRIEQTSPRHYRVAGKLQLHGASRQLRFEVIGGPDPGSSARSGSARNGAVERYQGKTKLKQTDFGIEPVSIAGGTVKVKDEIEIEFVVYPQELADENRR
jgi:polyisoprenoid-binding protein YceI